MSDCAIRPRSTSSAIAPQTLRALAPATRAAETRIRRGWIVDRVAAVDAMNEEARSRGLAGCRPINPQLVFWELNARLPDDCDSVRRRRHGDELVRRATWRCARDAVVALRWSRDDGVRRALRDRRENAHIPIGPSSRCTGDGAMQMNGNAEMLTVRGAPEALVATRGSIFLVLNNSDLNQVSWEMRVEGG